MKASVLVFVALLVVAIDCASHSRKHKNNKNDDNLNGNSDEVMEWPSPHSVFGFEVPSIFTGGSAGSEGGSGSGGSDGSGSVGESLNGSSNNTGDLSSGKHHSKSKKKHPQ